MILWVVERALAAGNVSRAIVATDDARILEVVQAAGFEAVMTRPEHASGSDRLAEVAATLEEAEIIVNVQGDEPLISPRTIERVVEVLRTEAGAVMATTYERISHAAEVLNGDVVKIVVDEQGRALYFSRAPIPYPRDAVRRYGTLEAALESDASLLAGFRKHTGLYAYRRGFLLKFSSWPASTLERRESLEQLRALEHGVTIRAVEADAPSIGVDTEDDLRRVCALVEERGRRDLRRRANPTAARGKVDRKTQTR